MPNFYGQYIGFGGDGLGGEVIDSGHNYLVVSGGGGGGGNAGGG